MMSFFVVNLLIPTEPIKVGLKTPSGRWELKQFADYAKSKAAIGGGQCAHTYYLENAIQLVPAALSEAAFE